MAQAQPKVYTLVKINGRGSRITLVGTVAELVQATSYTLECGASYQHEKGNKKINRSPTTINGLVTNLNNAVNNAAANGCADSVYMAF
jgi:hypothetical protein